MRPQRGDFDLAAGDRRVHAVERTEHGADRHEGGHGIAQDVDQVREHPGLPGVVLGLTEHAEREARITADPVFEGREPGV